MTNPTSPFGLCVLLLGALVGAPAVAHASSQKNHVKAQEARDRLATLVELAKQNAPEVAVAQAALSSSRSALVNAKLLPFGNPYLEVTAERGAASLSAVEAARHEVMLAETQAELLRAGRELAEVLGRDRDEGATAVTPPSLVYAAGKAELLQVLLSRRELSALSLRRLELLDRSWALAGEYVSLTGELP